MEMSHITRFSCLSVIHSGKDTDLTGDVPAVCSKVEFVSNQRNDEVGITAPLLHLFGPTFGCFKNHLFANARATSEIILLRSVHVNFEF